MNALYAILWFAAGVFALRYFFGGFFQERGRAEVASIAVIVAFAAGAYWPFSERVSRIATATAPSAAPAEPAPAESAPALPASMRDRSALCKATKKPQPGGVGSLDILRAGGAAGAALESGATFSANQAMSLLGWAAGAGAQGPAPGVCLLVDGRVVSFATVHYGGPRPDVVAAYRRDALLGTAFEVDLPARALGAGTHELRVGTLSANGEIRTIVGQRVVNLR